MYLFGPERGCVCLSQITVGVEGPVLGSTNVGVAARVRRTVGVPVLAGGQCG